MACAINSSRTKCDNGLLNGGSDQQPVTTSVRYIKMEPCWQFSEGLEHRTNDEFDIVADPDHPDLLYDSDVARARFLIPGFKPGQMMPLMR